MELTAKYVWSIPLNKKRESSMNGQKILPNKMVLVLIIKTLHPFTVNCYASI
jgi:hypothetical protein